MSPAIPLLGINPRLLLEGILIESNTLSNTLDLQGDQHKKIEDQLTLTEIIQKWTAQTEEEAIQTDKIPTDTMPHGETPGKHANPIKSTRQQKDGKKYL